MLSDSSSGNWYRITINVVNMATHNNPNNQNADFDCIEIGITISDMNIANPRLI